MNKYLARAKRISRGKEDDPNPGDIIQWLKEKAETMRRSKHLSLTLNNNEFIDLISMAGMASDADIHEMRNSEIDVTISVMPLPNETRIVIRWES